MLLKGKLIKYIYNQWKNHSNYFFETCAAKESDRIFISMQIDKSEKHISFVCADIKAVIFFLFGITFIFLSHSYFGIGCISLAIMEYFISLYIIRKWRYLYDVLKDSNMNEEEISIW
jgi:hypothetical protein